MEDLSESEADSNPGTSKPAARTQLVANIEQWALSMGAVTGALRAVLADVANAIKNSARVFSDAHRKAYSQKHIVRRKL